MFQNHQIPATIINLVSANPTKWSNTLKQFVGNLPTNCLGVFDHFVGLALTGLRMKPVQYSSHNNEFNQFQANMPIF